MKKIENILLEITPDIAFSDDVKLITDGYLDSLDMIRLVSAIEDEFKIIINSSDIKPENFETVNSICLLIKKYGYQNS